MTDTRPDVTKWLEEQRTLEANYVAIMEQLALVAVSSELSVPSSVNGWRYSEDRQLALAGRAARRAAAIEWLARHAKGIQAMARHFSTDVEKFSDDNYYGVKTSIRFFDISAKVPASLTCEMVPTGETETIPATEAREVPVMERKCPESIFAGIETELSPELVRIELPA